MLFLLPLLLAACSTAPTEPVTLAPGEVEVALVDRLDGVTSEYCIDIAGGRENVDPSNGLQGHTCYSYTGQLGTDQIIDSNLFAQNTIRLSRYDVCATAASHVAGASIELAACDGSERQQFTFAGTGTIASVQDPSLCMTVADATRSGRSTTHQIKPLTLETCTEAAATRQIWHVRTESE